MRKGRKSAAQTEAPVKDRIKGSSVNKKGSSSSTAKAKDIVLSSEIISALMQKAINFNKINKDNKVSLSTLKAVFRRGAGAFSTSHRPNMTRNGWAYARVNKFLEKKGGKEVKKAYIQDDDLMGNGGITTSVLKESSDLEALTIWSQKKVKESFGSEFESGFPIIYSTEEKGKINIKKAYGELKNGKKVIFDVDGLTWEEGYIYMEKGGEINADNPKIKNEMIHKSGKVGGLLVGKRHSEGGIKAINKSNNSPLEMEGGEVVITRNAVSDDTKREFEGEMLTNREILSRINEGGGGVSFAEGGDIPEHIMVSGKEYKYGGKTLKDSEIVDYCGCQHKMSHGGNIEWGDDLGNGFYVGNDVYITDNKSLFNGSTGFISGLAGKDLLVTISQNGNERNIIVSKKGVQKIDAPEFSQGGDTESMFYKGYEIGEDGEYRKPDIKRYGVKHHELKPTEAFSKMYGHKYKRGGEIEGIVIIDKSVPSYIDFKNNNKSINLHTSKSEYKKYLKNNYNIDFDHLPNMIQMGLLLGNQKLVDNYINA